LEIKLEDMKKLLILPFIILSCSTQKRDEFKYRNEDKKVWINTFKSEVFYECLKEGYKNDTIFKLMEKKDLFNSYDAIDFTTIDFARELGKQIIIKMPAPYIKIEVGNEYLKNKNFISYNCLNYYSSKELDSIANSEYEKMLKNQ
jgi:hypothetical protein